MGQTYGIPTKDDRLRVLPLLSIKCGVVRFQRFAAARPETFLVTPIGCGLAGYSPRDIAPMFFELHVHTLLNVRLPACFIAWGKRQGLI